jgi:hypothetical protein
VTFSVYHYLVRFSFLADGNVGPEECPSIGHKLLRSSVSGNWALVSLLIQENSHGLAHRRCSQRSLFVRLRFPRTVCIQGLFTHLTSQLSVAFNTVISCIVQMYVCLRTSSTLIIILGPVVAFLSSGYPNVSFPYLEQGNTDA